MSSYNPECPSIKHLQCAGMNNLGAEVGLLHVGQPAVVDGPVTQ